MPIFPGIPAAPAPLPSQSPALEVGDLVFIRVNNFLYRHVLLATQSWTSHVGVVIDNRPGREIVAESRFSLSCKTPWPNFVRRSESGRYSIKRLRLDLTSAQKSAIQAAAQKRLGKLYHTGFKFDSPRQFCSKFIYEIFREAVGVNIGEVETLTDLLHKNAATPRWFWRFWYLGRIPWRRRTITPASQYVCPQLVTVQENI